MQIDDANDQTAHAADKEEVDDRPRYICSMCGKPLLRVDVHLRGTHRLKYDPEEFAKQKALSYAMKADDAHEASTNLEGLMDAYRKHLVSYAGAHKDDRVARADVSRVQRLLEDLFNGVPYSPTLLRGLKHIGDVDEPKGLLWRYENGQTRAGHPLKATTIATYCQSLSSFCDFLLLNPQHLSGKVAHREITEWKTVVANCSRTFASKRVSQDMVRHELAVGTYCHPKVFGQFLVSSTVTKAMELLDRCLTNRSVHSESNFTHIRDVLMLSAAMCNARRTGELVNMTLEEFRRARPSATNKNDRIVFVRNHKVANKFCKINFYGKQYENAVKYVRCFEQEFLSQTGDGGRMFPQLSKDMGPVQMSGSTYNRRIKHLWATYVRDSKLSGLPDPSLITSSYIRKVFVTAIHPSGDMNQMAEVAKHMSHDLKTAEKHYDASGQLEATSRSTDYFRHLMWHTDESISSVATAAGEPVLSTVHRVMLNKCHSSVQLSFSC